MINSRQKLANGERELANYLKEKGYTARRGQQFSGANGDPDVICEEWKNIHIECKRVEKLNIENALQQSTKDARENEIPVVIHRKNKEKWKITLWLDDFVEMMGGDVCEMQDM